jgi:hypothetical protein
MQKVMRKLSVFIVASAMVLAFAGTAWAKARTSSAGGSGVSGGAVYNSIPGNMPGNVPSVGFEATQTTEFGDEIALGGTARTLNSMSVVLSSWACETGNWHDNTCSTSKGATFPVDITFTIYEDNAGTPGTVIDQETQTVNVPFRPSATSNTEGRWYSKSNHTYYNGYALTVKHTFSGNTQLTDQVIWSVSYPALTQSGPIDSLNVGVKTIGVYAGTDLLEDAAFRNGSMEPGWTGYRPLGTIVATS